jgi:hypothetical protein
MSGTRPTTPRSNIPLPIPSGDDDAWAPILNGALSALDVVADDAKQAAAAASSAAGAALPLAGGTMTGPVVLAADPAADLQAATKQYVDGKIATLPPPAAVDQTARDAAAAAQAKADAALPLSGGVMTGPVVLAADPAADLQAATKQYVDGKIASIPPPASPVDQTARDAAAAAQTTADAALPLAGGTMTGAVTLAGQPTDALHAVPKNYADNIDTNLRNEIGVVNQKATDAQADIDAHDQRTDNPHAVTAAQIGALPLAGGTMTGPIVLAADPAADLQATTKAYVDSILAAAKKYADEAIAAAVFAPRVTLNFRRGTLPYPVTHYRASKAWGQDGAGVWTEYAAGAARLSPINGLLVEGQRTNFIRNPRAEGVVAPAPPTNWTLRWANGVTWAFSAAAKENGIDYTRVHITGTATIGYSQVELDGHNVIAAAVGEIFSSSVFVRLVAGSLTNIGRVEVNIAEYNAGGGYLAGNSTPDTPTAAWKRFSNTRKIESANVGFATTCLALSGLTGPVDLTIDIGWPQFEKGTVPTTPILPPPGAPAQATRTSDSVSFPLSGVGITGGAEFSMLTDHMLPVAAGNAADHYWSSQILMVLNNATPGKACIFRNRAGGNVIETVPISGGSMAPTGPELGAMTPGTKFRLGSTFRADGKVRAVMETGVVMQAYSDSASGDWRAVVIGGTAPGQFPAPPNGYVGQIIITRPMSDAELSRDVQLL